MNFSHLMLGTLLATVLTSCATYGPDDNRRRDGTYSTHNYKHPNKAAQAQTWEASPGVPVSPPATRSVALDNYKRQQPGAVPNGGVTVPHQPSATLADRHYKTKNWMKTEPKPEIAKKPKTDSPTTGN